MHHRLLARQLQRLMGKDFIPFSKKEDAESFMQEHNGKKIYSFTEINKASIRFLASIKSLSLISLS